MGAEPIAKSSRSTWMSSPLIGSPARREPGRCGGGAQPLAERSHRSNTATRLVGALDAATGRVRYRQASHIGVAQLVGLYRDLRAAYPDARRLYVVQDHWPVHYHPDLLVALEPQ